MVTIKSPKDIEILKETGEKSRQILDAALSCCKVGVKPIDIDKFIEKNIAEEECEAWFKEVENYPYSSCISVNEGWLHGIPSNIPLQYDDIISIDVGVKYKGYYVDNCWTVSVSNHKSNNVREQFNSENAEITMFLTTGTNALLQAINEIKSGARIGNVSSKMQEVVESAGYSVIKEFVGHGVGYSYHEDPIIPCYGTRGAGMEIKKGMVFAVEVMYAMGKAETKVQKDGWTIATKDNSLTGMFEHTVLVTSKGVEILT